MKRNRLITLLGSIFLILTLAALPFIGGCAAPAPAETVTLRALFFAPIDHADIVKGREYIDRVNQRGVGVVQIELVGGPEVTPRPVQIDAVMDGVVDMDFIPMALYTQLLPEVRSVYISEVDAGVRRDNGYHDLLNTLHQEKMGLYYLGHWSVVFNYFNIFTNTRVDKLDDFAGQKLFAAPGWIPFLDALGITTVGISRMDVYTGAERGTIDGGFAPMAGIHDMGWDEVMKYVLDPGLAMGCGAIIVNLDSWNRLSKDAQQLLIDVAIEIEPELDPYGQALIQTERRLITEAGMEIIPLSPADAQRYLQIFSESMWGVVGKEAPELVSQLREMVTK